MRLILGCVLAAVCAAAMTVSAAAQDRQLRQTHTIEIEVECLNVAREVILALNGYNLEASVSFVGLFSGGTQRHAHFTRRVDGWAFRHVQEVLRGLGEVIFEVEHAQFLGGRILDVETRLAVLNREIERLTAMMAASTTLEVLIAVNDRLSRVARDRDSLIGTRNMLLAQAGSPVIHIQLTEPPEDPPPPVPTAFGSRVAASFTGSWRSLRSGAGNFLVFLVRISIPAVLWGAFAAAVIFIAFRVYKRKLARLFKPAAPLTEPAEEPAATEIVKKEGES